MTPLIRPAGQMTEARRLRAVVRTMSTLLQRLKMKLAVSESKKLEKVRQA